PLETEEGSAHPPGADPYPHSLCLPPDRLATPDSTWGNTRNGDVAGVSATRTRNPRQDRTTPMGNEPKFDSTVPHPARVWDYLHGGKDHYAVDREVGDQTMQLMPEVVALARESRAFLIRAVRYLAGEAGIDQFLDIGTGLPTGDNTHEVAQRINPAARIMYVD